MILLPNYCLLCKSCEFMMWFFRQAISWNKFPHTLQEILPLQISRGICQTNTTCAGGMMDDLLSELLAAPKISHPSGSCLGGEPLLSLSYLDFLTFFGLIMLFKSHGNTDACLWVSALHSLSRLYHSLPNFTTARSKIAHFTRLCTSLSIHGWTLLPTQAGW